MIARPWSRAYFVAHFIPIPILSFCVYEEYVGSRWVAFVELSLYAVSFVCIVSSRCSYFCLYC